MLLITIVSCVATVASLVLFLIAKAGIRHYMDLYQNENDAKRLTYIVNGALLTVVICSILTCTAMINKTGYNIPNTTEVENVSRH
jgi:hypothetical protein